MYARKAVQQREWTVFQKYGITQELTWLDVLRTTPGLTDTDIERYGTKPLLILIESYVLDCIGQLGSDRAKLAEEMAARAFRAAQSADWKGLIRGQLALSPTLDAEVRQLWTQNVQERKSRGIDVDPLAFARAFADDNFANSN